MRPDERLLVSLANVAVEKRNYGVALRILGMVRRFGLSLSPVGVSVLLKAHGRARNGGAVRKVVEWGVRGGKEVDVVLLNSAVDALVRCGEVGEARGLLEEERFQGLVDVQSFNTIIKGLVGQGCVEEGFDVVEDIRRRGLVPNEVTRNTLVSACAGVGDFDRALELAEADRDGVGVGAETTEDGSGQTDVQMRIALTSLVGGLAEKGRVSEAVGLLDDMKRRNAAPSDITYAALIVACFRCGRVEDAVRVFGSIPDEGGLRSTAVCTAFVAGLCQTGVEGNVRRARRVLKGMEERADVEGFNCVMEGMIRMGDLEGAEGVFGEMREGGFVPGTVSYTILMRGFAEGGRFGRVKGLFREMFERGVVVDRVALNTFLSACVRVGELECGVRVLEFMEEKGGSVAPGVYSYGPVIRGMLKKGEFGEAWGMYERMREGGVKQNAYVVEMITNFICTEEKRKDFLAERGARLLRDGYADGVDMKTLSRCRRKMLKVFGEGRTRRHFRGLEKLGIRSVSEHIFERHGWNDIDSGWRVL